MIAKVTFLSLGLACGLGLFTDALSVDTAPDSTPAHGGMRLAGDQSIRLLTEPGAAPGAHRIVATVLDHRSDPVVGAKVFFSSAEPFSYPLGSSTTDANGKASLRYIESPFGGTETFQACVPSRPGIPRDGPLLTCAFIYTPPVECFLVIGESPGSDSFTRYSHTWNTNLSGINDHYAITQASLPTFVVLDLGAGKIRDAAPTIVDEFCVQVLMWNPVYFASNPERLSRGLQVRVYSDGRVTGHPYGPRDGMDVLFETFVDDGQILLQFPFLIDGV